MPAAELREAFETLRDKDWQVPDDDVTWRWPRRIFVRTIDYQLLKQFVDERLAAFVDADRTSARVPIAARPGFGSADLVYRSRLLETA